MKRFVWLYILVCSAVAGAQPPDTMWTRHIGSTPDEYISASCAYGDGGFVLAGYCGFNGDEMGPQNFFVARTDADGWPFWMTEVGIEDTNEFGYAVTVTANGDIVLAGGNRTFPWGEGCGHVVRLNADGDVLWDHTYGEGPGMPHFCAITELGSGDLLVVGNGTLGERLAAFLMRITANGDTLWTRWLDSPTDENITDLALTAEGDVVLAGVTYQGSPEGNWLRLIRTDASGTEQWSRVYDPGEGHVSAMDVKLAPLDNGDFAVTATRNTGGLTDVWLVRIEADGDSLWSHGYAFNDYTTDACGIASAADGGIVVAAMAGSYPAYHIELIKASPNGDLLWHFPLFSDHYSMVLTGVLEVAPLTYVMTGTAFNTANQSDGLLIKTESEEAGVNDPFVPQPSVFTLSAFPNPFNPATTLSFTLPKAGAVKLTVFDITGREVQTLVNETMSGGEHQVNFDGAHLSSGIYFARLTAGSQNLTQKLLLVR